GTEAAVAVVKETANQLLGEIRANKQIYQSDPEKLHELVDRVVLPHFDFEYMSQLVLGRYWRQASSEQREQFMNAFKALLERTYGNSLLDNADADLEWLPAHGESGSDDVLVRSRASGGNLSSPVPINYRVHKTDNG